MDTRVVEEVMAAPTKGKRTKRHRPHSPIPFSVKPAREYDTTTNHRLSPTFSATASEESTTTEEEDTARCLILLAKGHFLIHSPNHHDSKRKREEETGGAAACMYACKTCNRVFPSFQALGGHRASHKKPKNEKKSVVFFSDEEDFLSPLSTMGSSKKRTPQPISSLQLSNISVVAGASPKPLPSPRIHECSYCGAKYTSGQALGGHMRRHRADPISPPSNRAADNIEEPEPEDTKKPRNGLSLDLNLPAPEDENQRFGFAARQQKSPEKFVTSTTNTPTLVDCHY